MSISDIDSRTVLTTDHPDFRWTDQLLSLRTMLIVKWRKIDVTEEKNRREKNRTASKSIMAMEKDSVLGGRQINSDKERLSKREGVKPGNNAVYTNLVAPDMVSAYFLSMKPPYRDQPTNRLTDVGNHKGSC